MKFFRFVPVLWITSACFLLNSCFDSREEIWIYPDSSGRAEITCEFPSTVSVMQGGNAGIERTIDRFLQETKGFRRCSRLVETLPNQQTRLKVAVEFNSALDMLELTNSPSVKKLPPAARNLIGQPEIRMDGLRLHLRRICSPGGALPGAAMLPRNSLTGHKMTTVMHLPSPALTHNSQRLENNGKTLVWETSLASALRTPVTMEFQMALPIPWTLIAAILCPGGLLLGGGFWLWRQKRCQRQ